MENMSILIFTKTENKIFEIQIDVSLLYDCRHQRYPYLKGLGTTLR